MKVDVRVTHLESGQVDIGDIPIEVFKLLLENMERLEGNEHHFGTSDLISAEQWDVVNVEVTPFVAGGKAK